MQHVNKYIPKINPFAFSKTINKLRTFFQRKGLMEAYLQNQLDILSACENPKSITPIFFAGQKVALPQTNQMRLEFLLMNDFDKLKAQYNLDNSKNNQHPELRGFFCQTTSYRDEAKEDIVEDRHDKTFPMAEFEFKGNIDNMIQFEQELAYDLGFRRPNGKVDFPVFKYEKLCEMYGVKEIEHEQEQQLEKDFGPVVFIKDFPERTNPYFNMKRYKNQPEISCKVDVIMGGLETIGSSEREINSKKIKENFYKDKDYSSILFKKFGKEKVEKELNTFLRLPFIDRVGGGIGISRLIKALQKYNLI